MGKLMVTECIAPGAQAKLELAGTRAFKSGVTLQSCRRVRAAA